MAKHYHASVTAPDFHSVASYVSESYREAARRGVRTVRCFSQTKQVTHKQRDLHESSRKVRGGYDRVTVPTVVRHTYSQFACEVHGYMVSAWTCYSDCLTRALPIH